MKSRNSTGSTSYSLTSLSLSYLQRITIIYPSKAWLAGPCYYLDLHSPCSRSGKADWNRFLQIEVSQSEELISTHASYKQVTYQINTDISTGFACKLDFVLVVVFSLDIVAFRERKNVHITIPLKKSHYLLWTNEGLEDN